MPEELTCRLYRHKQIHDRQIDELIGLARGIIADGAVNILEVKYLKKWLEANLAVRTNPFAGEFLDRVNALLCDDDLSAEKIVQLRDALQEFVGRDFELGEVIPSSSLQLDVPAPEIQFPGRRFCFTGDFMSITRPECELEVTRRGATAGSLTKKTNYLVVAEYATGSWKHPVFGNKIEKAVAMRREGLPISIVGESHWKAALAAFPPTV
jgi:NAD-dependent DNA ligase